MDYTNACKFLRNPSIASLGSLLGYCSSDEEKNIADQQASLVFELSGLLPSRDDVILCPYVYHEDDVCGRRMLCHQDKKFGAGFRFVCSGSRRPHSWVKINPLDNTIFFWSHLRPYQIIKILLHFFVGTPVSKAFTLCDVSKKHAIRWYRKLRMVMHLAVWHDFEPLGGPTFVVEVDETFLFKAKYGHGRVTSRQRKGIWSFGGVCRVTKKVFATVVQKRNRQTLFRLMKKWIRPQTHLCSDYWKAYNDCERPRPFGCGFASHQRVNHSKNFLSPAKNRDPLWMDVADLHYEARDKQFQGPYHRGCLPFRRHTQNAERAWRRLKKETHPATNITLEELQTRAGTWMYKENVLKNLPDDCRRLATFMTDIGRCYPGPAKAPLKNKWVEECLCEDCQPED